MGRGTYIWGDSNSAPLLLHEVFACLFSPMITLGQTPRQLQPFSKFLLDMSASTHVHSEVGPGLMLESAAGRGFNTKYQSSVPTPPPNSYIGPEQWFSTGGDSVPQETLLVVTRLEHCCCPLQGKGQGCCSTSHNAHDSPHHKELASPIRQ